MSITDSFEENLRTYFFENWNSLISVNQQQALEQESIRYLTLRYINWTDRLISPSPRSVLFSNEIKNNIKFSEFSDTLWTIHDKIKMGDDITPYLSKHIIQKAISLNNTSRSADKDGMLNE